MKRARFNDGQFVTAIDQPWLGQMRIVRRVAYTGFSGWVCEIPHCPFDGAFADGELVTAFHRPRHHQAA